MSHDYHDALPGYSPEQILHDGCRECEARSKRSDHGISNLDAANFDRAWRRAREWYRVGLPSGASDAEVPLLDCLAAVAVQFERRGVAPMYSERTA